MSELNDIINPSEEKKCTWVEAVEVLFDNKSGAQYDACLVKHEEADECTSCDRTRRRERYMEVARENDRNRDRFETKPCPVWTEAALVMHNAQRMIELGVAVIAFAESIKRTTPIISRSPFVPKETLLRYLKLTNEVTGPVGAVSTNVIAYAKSDKNMVDKMMQRHETGVAAFNATVPLSELAVDDSDSVSD